MKRTACALLLSGLCLPAYGDGLPVTPPSHDPSIEVQRQHIQFNDRAAATDDYMIALARAANVNIIADATNIPTDPPPAPAEFPVERENPMLGTHVFFDLVVGRKLTLVNFDDTTMLFWPPPDRAGIARQIRARRAAAPRHDRAPLDDARTNAMLQDYFRRVHKWDGNWETVDISVPLDDLPPELKAHVEAEIYRTEVSTGASDTPGGTYEPGSAFWQKIRFIVAPRRRRARDPLSPHLTTPQTWVRGGSTPGLIFGRLDFLAKP